MKNLFFCVVFLVMSAACGTAQTGTISTTEFEKRMAAGSVQLLDVRTAEEFKRGHLKNTLHADWLDKKQFEERTQHLDKNKPVLVYCASGIRSAEAMKWLTAKGFTNVANLKGGLSAWKMDGKTLVEGNAPEEMQVSNFTEKIKATPTVLVEVGAEWCPPCKKMEPVVAQLQKEIGSAYSLVKVDGGNDIAVMKSIQSETLPTFIVYKNGKETWRKQGIISYDDLKSAITK